jgi:protein ImuB
VPFPVPTRSRPLLAPACARGRFAAEIKGTRLTESLRFYTPDIEPSDVEPGVFWLGASGLSLLYPSLRRWAGLVREETARAGYRASIVVGFTRFGTYAIANAPAGDGIQVIDTEAGERGRAGAVELSRVGVPPELRDTLARLGITTLAGFLALPGNGIRTRFGETAHRLYRTAKGELSTTLQPRAPHELVVASVHLDAPETNLDRLVVVIDRALQAARPAPGRTAEVLRQSPSSHDDDRAAEAAAGGAHARARRSSNRTAAPGAHAGIEIARGVTGARIEAEGVAASHAGVLRGRASGSRGHRRRVRVDRTRHAARCFETASPEVRSTGAGRVGAPQPRARRTPPLVRHLCKPIPLPPPRAEAELIRHIDEERCETLGPHRLAAGREVQREYYFVRTTNGRALWMFYDRPRMGWFIHGEVE